jgi:effector-binding domain-containing protein
MTQLQRAPMTGEADAFARAPFTLEIQDRHPAEAAVVTLHMTPDAISDEIGGAFGEVAGAMAEAGVGIAGPPFTRYLAFGELIDAEAGFPVMRPAPDVGRVHPSMMPGGRTASMIHVGPYDALERTYGTLMAALAAKGLHPAGPMWEIYWSDPETADPATWRTEILVPVG